MDSLGPLAGIGSLNAVFTLNQAKSDKRNEPLQGTCSAERVWKPIVLGSRNRYEMQLEELSDANTNRADCKTHYDVATVEFWEENVDKTACAC